MQNHNKTAIIIGAGPAGLTAALELLKHTDIKPIVLESEQQVGGISRTIVYKGNRMDIGGHRFFSKSDVVMNWWLDLFPVQTDETELEIKYHGKSTRIHIDKHDTENNNVMLVRNRISRIYFLRKFFHYPISLSWQTFSGLGIWRTFKIGFSYIKSRILPVKEEKSLEDFLINRFGNELYHTFFKDYTEKVWGTSCSDISAEWGAQRIKGVSISGAIKHAVAKGFRSAGDFRQKKLETSLIEKFLYPPEGPGQLWEYVAAKIREAGGEIHLNHKVKSIQREDNAIVSLEADSDKGTRIFQGDYFFSTMPVKDLVAGIKPELKNEVQDIAKNLLYRDFITVGLLVDKLQVKAPDGTAIKDNWIYIQEKEVRLGRLQIFNNWSPYMVADPSKTWLGLEYFCNEGDELWNKSDCEFIDFAISELSLIGIITKDSVLDATVVRVPKTYPAYFGSYNRFNEIRTALDSFGNLFLIGRNGMHKYNNQDHSMLTAMAAVQNIVKGIDTKQNLWDINTEMEYHEEK